LIVGGALPMTAERLDPGQANLCIAFALLGVVLLDAGVTYFQEHPRERIMESFKKMLPPERRAESFRQTGTPWSGPGKPDRTCQTRSGRTDRSGLGDCRAIGWHISSYLFLHDPWHYVAIIRYAS